MGIKDARDEDGKIIISDSTLRSLLPPQLNQLVPKLLLQVSVRELHNSLVGDPNDGGLKDDRDENGKIIISDYTLRLLLPLQLSKCTHVTRLCVVVNVAFLIKVYILNCYPGVKGI